MALTMAAAQRTSQIASRCTPETARATLSLEISGYSSLHLGQHGRFIQSAAFPVGGYNWCIRYYPDGDEDSDGDLDESSDEGYVSVFLELLTEHVEVSASLVLRLIDPVTLHAASSFPSLSKLVFGRESRRWGVRRFKRRSSLEEASSSRRRLLQDDRLTIECEVTVAKDALALPSNLPDNLAKLLETKRGADVEFVVRGEIFHAHKPVLAMRSRVFDAEFYGPMATATTPSPGKASISNVTVEDMQPAVFRAFLHFLYTDSLPAMDDLEYEDRQEMVKHLLVAADRYAVERMKLVCEGILCRSLDADNVASMLALADQHHCGRLGDACVEFMIKLL